MTRVAVIGGGLAGLACAVALADRGHQVTVLEASTRLGGRAGSWIEPTSGDVVDIGPHIFHSEYHNMLAFLERLGTRHLICWQPGKVITLAGKPEPLALRHWPMPAPLSLLPSLIKAPGLRTADYLSMRRTAMRGMQFGEEEVASLDEVPALDFFRKLGVSEPMIDWWWRFAAMVVTNVPLERCSAASLLRIHAQLSGYTGLHFGFGAVGLGELYTVQATKVIEERGGRVRCGTPVVAICADGRVHSVILAGGEIVQADYVVSAAPPHQLLPLLPAEWRKRAPFDVLGGFEPCPYIAVYLWFDRDLRTERFVAHLWSPQRLNYDFYDLCQIRHGWRGRPTIMASNIIYSHRAHGMNDAEIVRATVAEIAEFAPAAREAHIVHADVHRIPLAIPCPVPGFEQRRPGSNSPLPGLVLAGDWTRTHLACTMESAVKSGFLAAEQVLRACGQTAQLAIPSRLYDGLAGLARRRAAKRRGVAPGPE
jgi:15-cis-phytoene desaturase